MFTSTAFVGHEDIPWLTTQTAKTQKATCKELT